MIAHKNLYCTENMVAQDGETSNAADFDVDVLVYDRLLTLYQRIYMEALQLLLEKVLLEILLKVGHRGIWNFSSFLLGNLIYICIQRHLRK